MIYEYDEEYADDYEDPYDHREAEEADADPCDEDREVLWGSLTFIESIAETRLGRVIVSTVDVGHDVRHLALRSRTVYRYETRWSETDKPPGMPTIRRRIYGSRKDAVAGHRAVTTEIAEENGYWGDDYGTLMLIVQ